MWNRVKTLLRQPQFYFVISVYPLMLFVAGFLRRHFISWVIARANYYGFIMFAVSILVVALAALEIATKLYAYNLQGDKLRMRQREGIEIEELKDKL